MRASFILRKERTFGDKVEATFEFIRLTKKPLFKSMLFYSGPFVLVGTFLVANIFNTYFATQLNAYQGLGMSESDYNEILFSALGILFILLFAITMVIAVVYSTTKLYEDYEHGDFSHKEVWKRAAKMYWPIFGAVFLYGVIYLILYFILMVPLSLIVQQEPLLVFPILYLFTAFFSVVALISMASQILDNKGLGNGMSQAFRLLKDNWWITVGLLIVFGLIYNSVRFVFVIPMYANLLIQNIIFIRDPLEEASIVQVALNYVFGGILLLGVFFSYIIPLVGMNLQFFSMSESKDAKALINRIDNLGAEQEEEEEDY